MWWWCICTHNQLALYSVVPFSTLLTPGIQYVHVFGLLAVQPVTTKYVEKLPRCNQEELSGNVYTVMHKIPPSWLSEFRQRAYLTPQEM